MKNKITILLIIALTTFISTTSFSQIQLAKGFKCVLGTNHANESYFTDGTFNFKLYPWGHDGISGNDLVTFLEKNYNQKIKFIQTKDGLWWGTGKVNDQYLYIIIADGSNQLTLSSTVANTQFSVYSTWMLEQIRKNITAGKDIYFTDFNGKECFGMK